MEEINKNNNKIDKKNKRKKNKVKRQISIFTIMLWIFLISTMIIITVNSTKKTNALEVEDENWNIQLVMYDRSSDTPTQAITEFIWNATKIKETKQLCMQINYACTTNKGYQPGEIEITIPGISKESFSEYWRNYEMKYSSYTTYYDYWLKNNIVIAADKTTDITKIYDWSYSYNEETNIYTFINNSIVEPNEHFEGVIQIVYNLSPEFKIKTDLEFRTKIKENIENAEEIITRESNICNFHYTATKKSYTLKNNATAGVKADYTKIEDILDDYYWVRYAYRSSSSYYIIFALDENGYNFSNFNNCIKLNLSEGVVIYDKNLNKVEPKENNTYYYLESTSYYYIGYPKNEYNEGDSVENIVELWGRYEDEEEMQKLAEASSIVNLVAFDFEYKGNLYGINKNTPMGEKLYFNKVKNNGEISSWNLGYNVFYTDSIIDVEIGDDLLYITRGNGEVTKLNDNEYNFTQINIPIFYTYNKYNESVGDKLIGYEFEIQVRYKDTNEYLTYSEGITSDENQYIIFDRNDIVGVKIVIKDLDKTLYSIYDKGKIDINILIHTKDCIVNGIIYNFGYLQVYKKDNEGNRILANEETVDSYKTPSTLKIAEYDMNTYGKYMQRNYYVIDIIDGDFILDTSKRSTIKNNVKEEKYEVKYTITSILDLAYYDVNKDVIIKQYDILPNGMNLAMNKEEIKNNISINRDLYSYLKLKDGTTFDSYKEFENYLKKNTTIDIDYNYKNSGRTKVSIIYNLNEIDWSYYLENNFTGSAYDSGIYIEIKTEIPYDSILEYGTSYTNRGYAMWNNQEYEYYGNTIYRDDGQYDPLARDIDNDGDIEEKLYVYLNYLDITHAVSSQQAVIKQVRTDLTKGKFVEETAEATAGSEYTYKLRVTTGANSLKDLIIYDTLETIYDENGNDISSGWKGKFLGVDTSYAVSKGYAPKVYYSVERSPGKLTEVPEKWMELTDDVDKTRVKSICVDLRYKADGTEMELSGNNVVFVLINMQAPEDNTILTSANNMFSTNWRAKDPLGEVIDNVEGIYSNQVNVEIHKEDIRTEVSGIKTWEDENDKRGLRPESITVKLLQDGQEYETKTVTEADNWQYTFENIPVYASNTREYEYEIVEDEVQNYETRYEGYNITNSIKLKDIEVTKIWEDNNNKANKRPSSIILQIYNGERLITEAEVNEESEWKHTFTNLQKYREDGSEIEYRVDEKSFATEKFYIKEIVGNVITNRFVVPEDTIDFGVMKIWEDNNDEAGKRPAGLDIKIMNSKGELVKNVGLMSPIWYNSYKLPKYDELGNEEKYFMIEEVDSKFYIRISGSANSATNKFLVPNDKETIYIKKIWDDNNNEAGKRPESITLQVKDGERVVQEIEANGERGWEYIIEVPKYDSLGNEIEYTIDEEYTNKFYIKEIVGNTITNRFVVPEDKIKIVGTKVWEDNENFARKRAESVILQVIANNEVVTEHEVNEANNWRYEFELAKYDRYGNEIEYHIDERDVGSKFYEKELTNATTVTNKFKVPDEMINLEVMKTWDDNGNTSGKRPESITLQVKNNGVVVAEQVVSSANEWKHTFELAKYNETGDEIEYTVDEEELDEEIGKFYIKEIVGNVITNKFVVPEDRIKIVGKKVWNDNGNAGGKRDTSVILQLKVGENIIAEAEVSDRNNWSYEFEVPKYDELGNEIEYYIDERYSGNKFYKKVITDKNTITNEFVVPEEKVLVKAVKKWEDNNNEYGKRPESVVLQVYNKDKLVAEEKVSANNNWSYEFKLPKYDEYGDEIEYTVDEKGTYKYYEKRLEGNTVINKCIYEPIVDTNDINILMYVGIFIIAVVGLIIGVSFVRKNKRFVK